MIFMQDYMRTGTSMISPKIKEAQLIQGDWAISMTLKRPECGPECRLYQYQVILYITQCSIIKVMIRVAREYIPIPATKRLINTPR